MQMQMTNMNRGSVSFLFLRDTEPCGLIIHLGGAEMEGTTLKVNHSMILGIWRKAIEEGFWYYF